MNSRVAEIAAVAQVIGSVGMFGVIWIVQLVHYPLMRFVSRREFPRFETEHRQRISLVVGPLMAVEGICVLAFLFAPPPRPALVGCRGREPVPRQSRSPPRCSSPLRCMNDSTRTSTPASLIG